MNILSKFGALVLATSVLVLSSCGQNTQSADNATSTQANSVNKTEQTEKVYNVAVDAAYAPFEYQDDKGNIVGFSVELMKAISADQKIKFNFTNTPYEGIFQRLQTGEKDVVLASCTITDERKKTMDFSDPYFNASQMIVVTDKDANKVNSLEDLKNSLVSVQTGTTGDLVMQKLQGQTSPKIKRMESMPLALNELLEGGVEASVGDNGVITYFIATHPNMKFKTIVDKSFVKEQYGFALAKNRKDDLLAKINAGLKDIRANGEYDKIYNKWFGKDGAVKVQTDAQADKPAVVAENQNDAKSTDKKASESAVKEAEKDVKDAAKDVEKDVKDAAKAAEKDVKNAAKDVVNDASKAVDHAEDKAKQISKEANEVK